MSADLIARLEASTEETQHVAIYDAIQLAHEQGWIDEDTKLTALLFRDDGAFLEAALMLVPAGWCWAVLRLPDGKFSAGMQKPPDAPLLTDDEWPSAALALCIAALKARYAA